MKNSIKVFKNEVGKTVKNPVALIIIIAICILPSLYAWVNIAASWDPYLHTATIPVVVVNNDTGAKFNGEMVNVGAQIVEQLEANDSIDWQFANQTQADLGLYDGTYYAMIEIDENFSADLTSLLSDDPIKPTIVYKIDNKENPVISKITTIAQETVVAQIKSNFLMSVNETAFASLNLAGDALADHQSEILTLKQVILDLDNNYDTITALLESNSDHAANLQSYLETNNDFLASSQEVLASLEKDQSNQSQLDQIEAQFAQTNQILADQLAGAVSLLDSHNQLLGGFSDEQLADQLETNLETSQNILGDVDDYLSTVGSGTNQTVTDFRADLAQVDATITAVLDQLATTTKITPAIEADREQIYHDLSNLEQVYRDQITTIIATVEQSNLEIASALADSSKSTAATIATLEDINTNLVQAASLNEEVSQSLLSELAYYHDLIHTLAIQLEKTSDDDLALITAILQSDPQVMADYLTNPFIIDNQAIFPIANYGSGMTPIYTVLAMWVGAIILTSILAPKAAPFKGDQGITIRQRYLGKLFYYLLLGFLQGLIMVIGNKFILGVQTANLSLFVLFGILTAVTFTTIVYTNVALLGPLGKALNIALLIFQLVGSGGSYPIQVDAWGLRLIQPFFPFTYALSGFREAIGGVVATAVLVDIIVLGVYIALNLVVGLALYGKIHHHLDALHHKLEDTELIE